MHVGFSYQNELPTLPGTFRKKTHPKPWPESPAANSPVSLGRVADGPIFMAGVRQLLTKSTEPLHDS